MSPEKRSRPGQGGSSTHIANGILPPQTRPTPQRAARLDWGLVLDRGRQLMATYDTSVTLRQLYYRLVSEQLIPNTRPAYQRLSAVTAQARRDGAFPALLDRGRSIHRASAWGSVTDALGSLAAQYRRDRTEGQQWSVYIGVEKAGIVEQLDAWFGGLGVPVLALGGYSSQGFVDDVVTDVSASGRPAVLLYAGDFDPSGEDIDRDFVKRTGCWDKVERVALTSEQVLQYGLPENVGKRSDSRARAFEQRHGALVQVELDALEPPVLRSLYTDALGGYWDESAYRDVLDREAGERASLQILAGGAE